MWLRRPMWTDAAAAHAVIFKAAEAAFRGDVHLIENLIGISWAQRDIQKLKERGLVLKERSFIQHHLSHDLQPSKVVIAL